MANETIYARQDNKVAAVADSTKKESAGKESTTLSEKDAKTIRKFLQELKPYEADALRIAIALADGKVDTKLLPSDEQMALNRYMNNGMAKEQSSPQQVQSHRIHQASQLCKRTANYCNKLQLLSVYEALMELAVNTAYVDQARAGLDRMTTTRIGQSPSTYGTSNGVTK
jgi:hypothetical protein